MNEIWINECDLKPIPGEIFERIGLLSVNSLTMYRHQREGVGSQIVVFKEFYHEKYSLFLREGICEPMRFKIIKRGYEDRLYWMVSPCQYRKIIEKKEIVKYIPIPKFDWSYC